MAWPVLLIRSLHIHHSIQEKKGGMAAVYLSRFTSIHNFEQLECDEPTATLDMSGNRKGFPTDTPPNIMLPWYGELECALEDII